MSRKSEPAWMQPIVLIFCLAIVGLLWASDHPTAATNALIGFSFIAMANRFDEWQERRRDDQRVAEEVAQRRHDELMHALLQIYYRSGGTTPMPPRKDDDD